MVFECRGRIALQAGLACQVVACQVVFERKGFAIIGKGGEWTYVRSSPVKWCLNEKVELLCKLAMPIIAVITSNLIRKITLNMLRSVPCYEVQQILVSGSPWEGVGL